MLDKAWAWGKQTQNIRVNPIHGEDEVKLVLSDTFEASEKNTEATDRSAFVFFTCAYCMSIVLQVIMEK